MEIKKMLALFSASAFLLTACGETATPTDESDASTTQENTQSEDVEAEETTEVDEEVADDTQADEETTDVEEETEEASVPREHDSALRSAQNYIDSMAFSEAGLFEQLTSEYGDNYPEEAAQYAIDNVDVDYNEEAAESAQNYLDTMPMSDSELFEQLTSEHGDQFTEEQAQYAIDNLPE